MRNIIIICLLFIAVLVNGQARNFHHTARIIPFEEDVMYLFEADLTNEIGGDDLTNSGSTFTATDPAEDTYSGYVPGNLDYFALPTSYTDAFPSDWTMTFWMKANGTQAGHRAVVSGTWRTTGISYRINVSGGDFDVFTNLAEISADNFDGGTSLQNQWHHYGVTYESSTGYVDIVINGASEVSNGAGTTGVTLTNEWFFMPTDGSGYIDDVRVFPKILTVAEIDSIYQHPGEFLKELL